MRSSTAEGGVGFASKMRLTSRARRARGRPLGGLGDDVPLQVDDAPPRELELWRTDAGAGGRIPIAHDLNDGEHRVTPAAGVRDRAGVESSPCPITAVVRCRVTPL